MGDEECQKREEKERKKAEIRKRLEEASKSKYPQKGFMTPQRKKKLRVLLRKLAVEELKKQQEVKAQERIRTIKERCGDAKSLDGNEAELIKICQEYHNRICTLEDQKHALEYVVSKKDFKIKELSIEVNAGHFNRGKPCLKRVAKNYYANKFMKQAKATEFNFRANLKHITDKFKVDTEITKESKKVTVEWAKK